MFDRIGVVEYDADKTDADTMLEAAIEAGADDVGLLRDAGHEVYLRGHCGSAESSAIA